MAKRNTRSRSDQSRSDKSRGRVQPKDDPRQAMESGEPQISGRMRGHLIEQPEAERQSRRPARAPKNRGRKPSDRSARD